MLYKDRENRIYMVTEEIDEKILELSFEIMQINIEDAENEMSIVGYERQPIKLFVNSVGGMVKPTMAVIRMIIDSDTPVYTFCNGYAYSAGFILFLAGSKRFAFEGTDMVYHQLSAGALGKLEDMQNAVEVLDKMQKDIEKYVESRTKITMKKLLDVKKQKKDWYIYSEEYAKLGIAEVI